MADIDGFTGIDRLKDHYKHCIRLSASNKINPKNAFDLQLIDYMQDLVSQTEDGQMNFKIASSALDVGAKIYSNRVDCIQSEAQKVASSILMALDGQHQNKKDDNADPNDTQADANTTVTSDRMNDSRENDEEGPTKAAKKKRANRSKNIKTVIDDQSLLDGKLEKMVLGDAFLDHLSQDYDMSCPAALICYNSLTQPDCLLTIESNNSRKNFRERTQLPQAAPKRITELNTIVEESETPGEKDDDLDQTQILENGEEEEEQGTNEKQQNNQDGEDVEMTPIDCHQTPSEKTVTSSTLAMSNNQTSSVNSNTLSEHNSFVTLITKNVNCAQIIRNNQTNHICPRLENFLFNDRTTTLSGLKSNMDTTDISNTSHPNLNSSIPTGRGHEFNLELYENGGTDDCGDDHFADAESNAGDEENQPLDKDLPDLDKIAASKPTDYGYSHEHSRLLNTWAGPHAWKAVKVPQSVKKNAPQSTRKRAKLEQKPINFEEGYLENLEKIVDKNIRHSRLVIRSWKKGFIPEDHNLTGDRVRQETIVTIYNRPEETYHCFRTTADASKLVDKDHDYSKNDENEEREVLASPGLGGFDDVLDDSDDEFRADPVEGNELAIYSEPLNTTVPQLIDLEFAGENLIEQPYTVTHVNIPFAKIAKKMDVRKLKRVMWDLLLPPEKRLELKNNAALVANGTSNEDNGRETNENSDNGTLIMMGGDDNQNATVIMNGVEEAASSEVGEKDKTGPSPAPSESAVHLRFSNLYGELPVRVSSKMASDLSQPIAFVTLLHLANEKNLRLIPKQDLKDFVIEQDELD